MVMGTEFSPSQLSTDCDTAIKQIVTLDPHDLSAQGEHMHVGWGADGDFLLGCMVSMASVAYHNPSLRFHFHLFTSDSHLIDMTKLNALAEQQTLSITVYTLDDSYFSQLPTSRLWSSAIYYRFVLAQYLSASVERLLYLDADVVCQGALSELVTLPLDNAVAAVVPERNSQWWQHQADTLGCAELATGYFNSGVMLLNLRLWRQRNILAQLFTLAAQPELQPRLTFFDQDLLNLALVDQKIMLSTVYNSQYSLNYELNDAKRKTFNSKGILMHFIGPTKPWHLWAQYPSGLAFQQVKARSPWRDDPLHPPKSTYQYRYCYKHMVRQKKLLAGYGYLLQYLLRKLFSRR